jgi:predicted metal-dependent HD superfamily phosphohydrolase
MKVVKSDLLDKSEAFARKALSGFPEDFHYHDLHHTLDVVEAAEQIALKSQVSPDDIENILVAAWFHDLGYRKGMENHERESVKIMKAQLKKWEVAPAKIKEIERLIEATRMPHNPTDLLSRIMCDADLFHLCQPDFQKRSEDLRKELNCICSKNIQPSEWIRMNLEFLKAHNYFTDYGKKVLGPLKRKTLTQIKHRLSRL